VADTTDPRMSAIYACALAIVVVRAILACMQAINAPAHATSAQLAAELATLWHEIMRGTGARMVEALNEHDLTLTQMKALNALDDASGERSVKDLGACLAMSLPAASRTAEGLLQRGLVAREEDPADRRIKRLTITDDGRDVLRALESARLVGLEAWSQGLTTRQRDALHTALLTLSDDEASQEEGPSHA
jgi:DNA-binding MarR family transcriptional regulator